MFEYQSFYVETFYLSEWFKFKSSFFVGQITCYVLKILIGNWKR